MPGPPKFSTSEPRLAVVLVAFSRETAMVIVSPAGLA